MNKQVSSTDCCGVGVCGGYLPISSGFFNSFFSRPSLLDDGGFFDRKEDSFFDRKEDSIFDRKGSLFDNERSIIANNSGTKIIYILL